MAYYIWKSYRFEQDPCFIFEAIKDRPFCFFLDSSLDTYPLGRYSFLGHSPFYILKSKAKNPFGELRTLLDQYKFNFKRAFSPFLGGAVGFFGYDLGFILEKKLSKIRKDDLYIPDCWLGFYSSLIIIDHLLHRLYLFACGFPEKNYLLAKSCARKNFMQLEAILAKVNFLKKEKEIFNHRPKTPLFLESNFSRQEYIKAVKKAKEYIRQGDIYQVNLSQRFKAAVSTEAPKIYKSLRKLSPAFFSAYLDCGDFQIISSSPESFLRVKRRKVWTRPMKGTRKRSQDRNLDKHLGEELMRSPKDKAELMMIVDLERNDLGKSCNYRSIKVESLRNLEKYKTVFQTTATISGNLHRQKDRVDLIKACFPGGSITGCPKVRAIEIIEELEPHRRGIYTGSLGYLSFNGNMDLNILIRTILKQKNNAYFGAGGGIVADSCPDDEYEETLIKARAMLAALG